MGFSPHPYIFAALGLALSAMVGGCRGCANDHPYVPPASETPMITAADAAAPLANVIMTNTDGGINANVEPALVAPPASTSWQVQGMNLEPGGGREIVLALVRDFDGDGQKDALAIVRLPPLDRKPGAPTGELVFFHGGSSPPIPGTVAMGPPLDVQPSCAPIARLEMIGPHSAFAEMGSTCAKGDASRSIVVLRLALPMPAVSFDATVADPSQAPKLTIDADSADRDKDGIDDVVLRVSIEGTPRLSARLAFFDRPAGPSRDPEEPEASLKAIASQAAVRALRAKEAASVPPLVEQMRALYRAMCLEGGAPRITKIHGGSAAACGHMKPLEDANVAEARAYATQGDALRAFAAAESAQIAPATKTAAKTSELTKILNDAAPSIEVKNVRTLGTIAVDQPPTQNDQITWGPLAFEFTGKLIARHGKSVARVDPESGESETADMVWKDDVLSPDGKSRWLDAYHACEGVALHASFAPVAEGEMTDVALPIAPRLGKSCSGGRGETASATPIAWGSRGLEAVVAGQPVLINTSQATAITSFLDETPPPGSPRSHNAKNIVLTVPTGVLVRGRNGDKWNIVKSSELEPYADLKKCTINDDASRIACVRRGKVVIVTLQ